MANEPKTIYITAMQGPRLSICGYCRKVTGNVTAIISTPFYELVGPEYASIPDMLSIRFKPVDQCMCIEEVLKGTIVEQSRGAI
jgi:hypothetical protein